MTTNDLCGPGENHWMVPVPLDFLREGDRFTLVSDHVRAKPATGVTTMDGHSVSEEYGLRTGNSFYHDNPDKNYINVHWDGVEYTPEGVYHHRDLPIIHSLYAADGVVYVSREIAARVTADKRYNDALHGSVNARKKQDLLAQVAKIEKQIREL